MYQCPQTHCSQCLELCVGPVVLACGHVTCRKCLRDTHQLERDRLPRDRCVTCQLCQRKTPLATEKAVGDVVAELGSDHVLGQLVLARLERTSCHRCQNREAEKVCHDCKQQLCDTCSRRHLNKGQATHDHQLAELPPRRNNTPTASRPSTGASSSASSDSSSEWQQILDICNVSLTSTSPRPQTAASSSPTNVHDHTDRPQSAAPSRWAQWKGDMVTQLTAAASEHGDFLAALDDVIKRSRDNQGLMQGYVRQLRSLREGDDGTDALERRLEVVRRHLGAANTATDVISLCRRFSHPANSKYPSVTSIICLVSPLLCLHWASTLQT